jgi:glucokinase
MAAVDDAGALASEVMSVATGRGFGPEQLEVDVARLRDCLASEVAPRPIGGLGFGTAGVVRPGPLSLASNLPRLNGHDLRVLVQRTSPFPVAVENDARCFTLAEARFGAARGARHVVGLTLGTGVGCGVLVEGRLLHGAGYEAGEVWAIPLRDATLEESVSGRGVVRGFAALGGDPGRTAAQVADAARDGDERAREAWSAFGRDVGFLCMCALTFLDPETVVLGGSLAKAHDLFRPSLDAVLKDKRSRVVFSALGPPSGLIGAAALTMPGVLEAA